MARPPLHSDDEIPKASASTLFEQLRWELQVVRDRKYRTNEELAQALGYDYGSSVTRWLRGHAVVAEPAAQKLDDLGETPTIGGTFAELRAAYSKAVKRRGPTEPSRPRRYDVFLASPMASTKGDQYRTERTGARDIKTALETWCEFSVYYAGDDLESDQDFETPEIAAEKNFEVLETVRFFVLAAQTPLDGPSSVHVEAGYALARRIPSLYIVRDHASLPFVLRKLGEYRAGEILPPVSIQYLPTAGEAVQLIKRHGKTVFERLASISHDGPKQRKLAGGRAG